MPQQVTDWPDAPVTPRLYRRRVLAAVGIAAGIAGCIGGLYFASPAQAPAQEAGLMAFCHVDRELPDSLTVSGPAGGRIRVDGRDAGYLESIAGDMGDEVADDAGPYSGILYNVAGPGRVTVNDVECHDA